MTIKQAKTFVTEYCILLY